MSNIENQPDGAIDEDETIFKRTWGMSADPIETVLAANAIDVYVHGQKRERQQAMKQSLDGTIAVFVPYKGLKTTSV